MITKKISLKGLVLLAGVFLLIVLSTFTTLATTYNVSSSSGDDAYKGNSKSTPWKTIAKVTDQTGGTIIAGANPPNYESDGIINIFDLSAIIDRALERTNCIDYCSGKFSSSHLPFHPSSLSSTSLTEATVTITIGNCIVYRGSHSNPVEINLDNSDKKVRGVQMDICDVDDYLTCTECETTDRTTGFTCKTNELANGCCRAMLFSSSNDLIEEGTGPIFTLRYDVSEEVPGGECRDLNPDRVKPVDESGDPFDATSIPGDFCFNYIISPQAGDRWVIGTRENIIWNPSIFEASDVKIEIGRIYCVRYWQTIINSTENTGSYDWNVRGPTEYNAIIRITSVENPDIYGESESFSIIMPTITVTSPTAGVDWEIGSTYTIEWTSSGVDGDVKIEVSRPSACGRLWSHIAEVPVSDGSYPWPVEEPAKNNCIVRITSIDNPDIYGESGYFDIVEPPPSP